MTARRLLLVEDNHMVSSVVARTLKTVEVVITDCGEDALLALEEGSFGMALVDVSLDKPGPTAWRSGIQLALEIARRTPGLAGRIYLFTGHRPNHPDLVASKLPVVEKPILDIPGFRKLVDEVVAR